MQVDLESVDISKIILKQNFVIVNYFSQTVIFKPISKQYGNLFTINIAEIRLFNTKQILIGFLLSARPSSRCRGFHSEPGRQGLCSWLAHIWLRLQWKCRQQTHQIHSLQTQQLIPNPFSLYRCFKAISTTSLPVVLLNLVSWYYIHPPSSKKCLRALFLYRRERMGGSSSHG